jgi:cyclic pyranopterin monophosphate synthase
MADNKFTHIDESGNPQMVDVGGKGVTERQAVAQAVISLPKAVVEQFVKGDVHTKKGPVFQTAILAGIMAAKKTSDLIPLCHPLALNKCDVTIHFENSKAIVQCTVACSGKTGVEMEALTGASVAALTVYDMCKAFSHEMVIEQTRLLSKSGGKRDFDNR